MTLCDGSPTPLGCSDAKGTWKCVNKFQRKGKCRKIRKALKKCQLTCGLCGHIGPTQRG